MKNITNLHVMQDAEERRRIINTYYKEGMKRGLRFGFFVGVVIGMIVGAIVI